MVVDLTDEDLDLLIHLAERGARDARHFHGDNNTTATHCEHLATKLHQHRHNQPT